MSDFTAACTDRALSGPRQYASQTTTVTSTQEGCGPEGLRMEVTWRPLLSGKVEVRSVLVDNDDSGPLLTPYLSAVDEAGTLRYAGPNGHGRVGDGKDYLWTAGWEENSAGELVRIGASDWNGRGWTAIRGESLTVRASWGGARYCEAAVTIPDAG